MQPGAPPALPPRVSPAACALAGTIDRGPRLQQALQTVARRTSTTFAVHHSQILTRPESDSGRVHTLFNTAMFSGFSAARNPATFQLRALNWRLQSTFCSGPRFFVDASGAWRETGREAGLTLQAQAGEVCLHEAGPPSAFPPSLPFASSQLLA